MRDLVIGVLIGAVLAGAGVWVKLRGGGGSHGGSTIECAAGTRCTVALGVGSTYGESGVTDCSVFQPGDYPFVRIGVDTQVDWILPVAPFGRLEFVEDPGVQILNAPDFAPVGFGAGNNRSVYTWKGTAQTDKMERQYKFKVQYVPDGTHTDPTIQCGSVDPTIVNSL